MPISLLPATAADVGQMARLSDDAFRDDLHTQMKTRGRPSEHGESMRGALESWLQKPERLSVVKAVDEAEGGAVLGWVCWATRRRKGVAVPSDPPAPVAAEQQQQQQQQQPQLPPTEQVAAAAPEAPRQDERAVEGPADSIEELEALTDADLDRWQDILMPTPETECMYIIAINVSPRHQSRGVGSALVRWGTRRADELGLFCWVHSSEAGRAAFEKQGFEEVGHLTVNLDRYAQHPRDAGDASVKWGEYTFRYMKRPAQPTS